MPRKLIVIADDFGMGPATSAGILDLGRRQRIQGTVLLVNSPHAAHAVTAWRQSGQPLALGWHLCLTMDRPLLPPAMIPSLVREDGFFHPLPAFLRRYFQGLIRIAEVEAELRAQYERFIDLVGAPPALVNGHHHLHILPGILSCLMDLVRMRVQVPPYLRRVREPWPIIFGAGFGIKRRSFLNFFGRSAARRQQSSGFPGNQWLTGLHLPRFPLSDGLFGPCLKLVPGQLVELVCHPGLPDNTLLHREPESPAELPQRYLEYQHLLDDRFLEAVARADFNLIRADQVFPVKKWSHRHAA